MTDDKRSGTNPTDGLGDERTARFGGEPIASQRDGETLFDPFGFMRLWSRSPDDARDGPSGPRVGPSDPLTSWRRWKQAGIAKSGEAVELATSMWGLVPRLGEAAGKAWKQVLTEQPPTPDAFDLFQRWFDAASGPLAEVANEVLENEVLLRSSKRLSDYAAMLDKASRIASERSFSRLQLATASDVERIARMIINLDDKIDRLEEELEQGHGRGGALTVGDDRKKREDEVR